MEIVPMSNQNQTDPGMQTDPGVQNEGSKPDAQRKESDQLNRKAEKEQEEKLKKGGTDEIKIAEDSSIIDGVPGYR
jgi:hypothetical protein